MYTSWPTWWKQRLQVFLLSENRRFLDYFFIFLFLFYFFLVLEKYPNCRYDQIKIYKKSLFYGKHISIFRIFVIVCFQKFRFHSDFENIWKYKKLIGSLSWLFYFVFGHFLSFCLFFAGQRHAHQRMTKRKRRRSLVQMMMNKKIPKIMSKVNKTEILFSPWPRVFFQILTNLYQWMDNKFMYSR